MPGVITNILLRTEREKVLEILEHFIKVHHEMEINKRYLRLGVTRAYLNLLVKPRIFFRFSGKKIILCILKGETLFLFGLSRSMSLHSGDN